MTLLIIDSSDIAAPIVKPPPPATAVNPNPISYPFPGTFVRSLIYGMSIGRPETDNVFDLLSWNYVADVEHVGLDGSDTDLDIQVLDGADGGYVANEDTDRGGLNVSNARITLPVLVRGDNPRDVMQRVEQMRQVLSVRSGGSCVLTVVREDGQSRFIRVYHEPKTGDFKVRVPMAPMRLTTLRLTAVDPFWKTLQEPVIWRTGAAGGGELPIELPSELAGSNLLGTANVFTVEGDEPTYPKFTFQGPFASLIVRRGDGKLWRIVPATAVNVGEVLVVDHNPRTLFTTGQVIGPDGSSWYKYLDVGSDLFTLRPGEETLTITATATSTTTRAAVQWESNWRNAI